VVLDSKTVNPEFVIMIEKMLNLIKKLWQKDETLAIKKYLARERNHRIMNFRECEFHTKKPQSFCSVSGLM
jgi:hypothetical protein